MPFLEKVGKLVVVGCGNRFFYRKRAPNIREIPRYRDVAYDHEHVSAGEKEAKKIRGTLGERNTDNFSILPSVLSRSTLHFRLYILIKVCRETNRSECPSMTVLRPVDERTFPISRVVFSKSVRSWFEWMNRVCQRFSREYIYIYL